MINTSQRSKELDINSTDNLVQSLLSQKKNSVMKYIYLILFVGALGTSQAQTFEEQFSPIRQKLEKWDPIRGAWLALSMLAMSEHKAIPDRTFPEDFTPYEMLTMVPMSDRKDMESMIQQSRLPNGSFSTSQWNVIDVLFSHSFCNQVIGRSFGDPHLKSFDEATYSFQTVGEFVLAKSEKSQFEVQTRQRAQSDNFSLNAAVAMNVAGDRVCYYASTKPDNLNSNLRLNGMPVQLQGRTYFLPNGGVIRFEGRNYTVSWPTGEMLIFDVRSSSEFGFVNTTVHVFACDAGMGSSAMGASLLRNKLKAAGLGDVKVTNAAIANLTGNEELIISHSRLSDRAKHMTPDAIHYSVENFMASPKYDEVVALLQAQRK